MAILRDSMEQLKLVNNMRNNLINEAFSKKFGDLDSKKALKESSSEEVQRQLERAVISGDEDMAFDIALYLENTYDVYSRFITPTINAIKKYVKKGTFDKNLAVQAFYNVVLSGIRTRDFYRTYDMDWKNVSVPTRWLVAQELADRYEDDYMSVEE